jgi:murein DD-endopeptidase MepM/ murein hydrolase activator NlpD
MTHAHRDLATPELWNRSLERSRRRRELLPRGRREHNRRKHLSAALATAVVAGPAAPLAAAQVSGDVSARIAAESPANRAIEIREGGLPLQLGSQGELVAHVQKALHVSADGIFGPQTDAAVREYQASAGLEVDGIVGLATWGALFEQGTASGAALGGSNIPPAVQERVEQKLTQAGQDLAADGQIDGDTGFAAPQSGNAPPASAPAPPSAQTPTTTPAPTGQACGSSTISSPVNGTVTSNFGPRWGRNHDGIDIAAPTGTAVRAAACGTVSLAGQQSGYGNMVCITHTSQFSTCYAHLSRFGVTNGVQVRQGQVIGYVGCTGNCTGPHLHFETRVGGRATDPRAYLGGASIPGQRANVAGASTTGAEASATGTEATVTQYGIGGGDPLPPEATTSTGGGVTAPAGETLAPAETAPVPAETAVDVAAPAPVPAETAVDVAAPAPVPAEAAVDVAAPAPVPAEVAVPAAPAPVPAEVAVPAPAPAPVDEAVAAAPAPPPAEAAAAVAASAETGAVDASGGVAAE